MSDPVRLMIVANEPEAEFLCGILRDNGFVCATQITDMAFGGGGEMPLSGGGAREILVRPEDLEAARELLASISEQPADES